MGSTSSVFRLFDFQDLVVQHGNFESQGRIFGAICAALS
jgi:hypothetical protein